MNVSSDASPYNMAFQPLDDKNSASDAEISLNSGIFKSSIQIFSIKIQSVPMYNRENITDITDFLTDFHGFLPNICYK